MEARADIDFDATMRELIEKKRSDPDRILFEGKLEIIREAHETGVSLIEIWTALKSIGFRGGRDKLVRFLDENGLKRKRNAPGTESEKRMRF